MSKECTVCFNINHSSANHCSICGTELPDKELSVEDQLRLELSNSKTTIENLNNSIANYQDMLANEKDENVKLKNLISENEQKLMEITEQLSKKKKNKTLYTMVWFIPIIIFVGFMIWINKLHVIISDLETDKINLNTLRTSLQVEIDSLKNTKNPEITREVFDKMLDYVNCKYANQYIYNEKKGSEKESSAYFNIIKPKLDQCTYENHLSYSELFNLLYNNEWSLTAKKMIQKRKENKKYSETGGNAQSMIEDIVKIDDPLRSIIGNEFISQITSELLKIVNDK